MVPVVRRKFAQRHSIINGGARSRSRVEFVLVCGVEAGTPID